MVADMSLIRKLFFYLILISMILLNLNQLACLPPIKGEITGFLQSTRCPSLKNKTSFKLDIHFVAMQFKDDTVEIRLQPYAGSPTDTIGFTSDILLLQIRHFSKIKKDVDIPIIAYKVPTSSKQTPQEWNELQANVSLYLGKTCPQETIPFKISGNLRFASFGTNEGDLIEISQLQLQLEEIDSQEKKISGELKGQLTFNYHSLQNLDKDITMSNFVR